MDLGSAGLFQYCSDIVFIDTAARQDLDAVSILLDQRTDQFCTLRYIRFLSRGQYPVNPAVNQILHCLEGIRCFIKCLMEDSFCLNLWIRDTILEVSAFSTV